jgi:hypothetical protein
MAAWLYVVGLCYCNRLMTDGFIPFSQVDRLSPHRQDQDLRDGPLKLAETLVSLGLWNEGVRKGVSGFIVHDYKKYQPSRKQILTERSQNHSRQQRFREGKRNGTSNAVTNGVSNAPSNGAVTGAPFPIPIPSKEQEQRPRVSVSAPMNGTTDSALADRAARFCERYQGLYQQFRGGARYLPRPALDFSKALELCAVWDDERLGKLATVFLKTNHDFASSGSRTIGQFAAMASWADDRLTEAEAGA